MKHTAGGTAPKARLRRLLAWMGVPLALLGLGWAGHRAAFATVASAAGPSAFDASAPAVAKGDAGDGPSSEGTGMVETTDALAPPRDAQLDAGEGRDGDAAVHPIVEVLADGGVVVDLNRASEEELRRLPGIGATRAKAILELRARLGRFKSVDDLARIKGFGRTMLRRLRPQVRT